MIIEQTLVKDIKRKAIDTTNLASSNSQRLNRQLESLNRTDLYPLHISDNWVFAFCANLNSGRRDCL